MTHWVKVDVYFTSIPSPPRTGKRWILKLTHTKSLAVVVATADIAKRPFTLAVNGNVCICICTKLLHSVFGDVDVETDAKWMATEPILCCYFYFQYFRKRRRRR